MYECMVTHFLFFFLNWGAPRACLKKTLAASAHDVTHMAPIFFSANHEPRGRARLCAYGYTEGQLRMSC